MPELTPQAFSERWSKSKLSERSSAQSHFIDLCNMLGKPTPAEADPDGDFYTFERRVKKTGVGAGKGFADVWYRGHFAFEYKGKHKDLGAAYDQLLRYREDLGRRSGQPAAPGSVRHRPLRGTHELHQHRQASLPIHQ